MWSTEAALQVHPNEACPFSVVTHVQLNSNGLLLTYEIQGPTEDLCVPFANKDPQRRDQLWQTTCMEAFMSLPHSASYVEWNWSHSGDWACYQFASYRKEIKIPSLRSSPQVEVPSPTELRVRLSWEILESVLPGIKKAEWLQLGLTAVLQTNQGETYHLALVHLSENPDFHRLESFNCLVPIAGKEK